MANEGNLIPNSERTPSELRAQTRKGGIASGEARRRKRDMRELFNDILSMPIAPGELADVQTISEVAGKNITVAEAIGFRIAQKAVKGDVRAAEFIRDTAGQKPAQGVQLTGSTEAASAALSALISGVRDEMGASAHGDG